MDAPKTRKVLEFQSRGGKILNKNGKVIDHGTLGGLKYEMFQRGVIHVFDDKNDLRFKKDPDVFEDEVDKIDFDKMKDGDEQVIEGSGDNPNLVFRCRGDDIKLMLRKKEFKTITLLRRLLCKAKNEQASS